LYNKSKLYRASKKKQIYKNSQNVYSEIKDAHLNKNNTYPINFFINNMAL